MPRGRSGCTVKEEPARPVRDAGEWKKKRPMSTQMTTTDAAGVFTPAQWRLLHVLRDRYHQDRDLFTPREMTRLRFVRWLHDTGRLIP